MRSGMNPNRHANVNGYAPIVLAAITHLPELNGYHEHRLDVIKCCLETMRDNTEVDHQILVWDNGSTAALTHWLKRSYQPDYLITGPNIGKWNARASITRMLPEDTILGVTDDDMYFYPGWLEAHLEVFNKYPRVGTVSGCPVRTQFRFHNTSTIEWGKRFAQIEAGRFISEDLERDFCTSIGRDYEKHKQGTANEMDIRLRFAGLEVYATGHHCQFVGRAGILAEHTVFSNEAMPSERPFEQSLDINGLLRLTTVERYTQHIGNILDERLEEQWRK